MKHVLAKGLCAGIALALGVAPIAAAAQGYPSPHPGYLRALSDLRIAIRLVQHHSPFEPPQSHQEGEALKEMVFAANDVKEALAYDGTDPSITVPPDMNWDDHGGRLHRAMEFLQRARDDLFSEPDNPVGNMLRDRAASHISNAKYWTNASMQFWHF